SYSSPSAPIHDLREGRQFRGTFLTSPRGDTIKESQQRAPQQRAPHPAPWRSREAANRREPDRKEKGRWSVQPSPRKPAPSRDRALQPIRWSARYRTGDHEPRIAALFDLVPPERLLRLPRVRPLRSP